MWLGDPEIMAMLYERLIKGDGERYRLDAFSIMSNHLHIVFRPNLDESALTRNPNGLIESEEDTLGTIMQWIKGGSARKANQILGRTGPFWEVENFDHYVRNEAEFNRIVRYVLNNPVKAGLVSRWQDWPGSFLAERLRERFR
jgi:REP element-mobilizing transposase RayT